MIFYFIPLVFLSFLTAFENLNKFRTILKNSYFYYSLALFFILFIGLRHEIGCDWYQYIEMFNIYQKLTFQEMLQQNFFENQLHTLQEFGHIFLTTLSRNIYVLNLIYAIIFTIPIFYYASFTKNKYLSLLVSYPYYMIVVGMGPLRQGACISILMISILLVSKKKYYLHSFLSTISLTIHQFSLPFNLLILLPFIRKISKLKLTKRTLLIIMVLIILFIYGSPAMWNKIYFYTKIYSFNMNPAKGAIYTWFLLFVPNLIFIKNQSKFKLSDDLRKIFVTLAITEFTLFPIVFFNSVVAYRLLLYIFPSTIFITSQIPNSGIIRDMNSLILNSIILSSFLTLFIWLKFAYHSYCWVPYKNILLMQ